VKAHPLAPNIVVVSDNHAGCRFGLLPPEGVILDGGLPARPSRLQLKMWEFWEEGWDWVRRVTKGEPWDFVHNGDIVDGVHHGATSQITHNMKDQRLIAVAVLKRPVDACHRSGGRFYSTRGTPSHVGPSGEDEESVAKELGAVKNENGEHSHWELWHRVGRKGTRGHLCHFAHHIGTTSSQSYESTAVHKEKVEQFVESGKSGSRPPDVIVRSHRHRYIEIRQGQRDGMGVSLVTPGWQAKTPFSYRLSLGRVAPPEFGLVLIRAGDEELHTRFYRRQIERPKEL
jgi:hypothetical protein